MEEIQALLESSKYTPLTGSDSAVMKLLLENTEKEHQKALNEGTISADIAQFTPILMPMVRRVYPNLIANELLGVQPMSMPTGFIYALTNEYTGDADNGLNGNLKIIKTADDASGIAVYSEGDLYLVAKDADLTGLNVTETYSNEAAFAKILKGYTGTYSTAQAEKLGRDMKEIGFSIDKKSVAVNSRALKGQYTVEMYQDLKAQHGLLADEEIMSLMSYEMQAEIDREVVDFVNATATQLADSSAITSRDGRWEIEKYRTEVIRLAKESTQIGIDTKRGNGNTILCSPKVATMFEQVGSFKGATQTSGVSQPLSGGVAGTFDGKYKVIVDQYATSDYATLIYKGADRRDAMGFFAPYVPLSFTKVTNADSGQPAIIAKTRYALDTIPGISSPTSTDRAEKYARSFGIDFTDTVLA
ncbi:MAG: hypothetical protein ABF301_07540 [Sulfurovum sp.]